MKWEKNESLSHYKKPKTSKPSVLKTFQFHKRSFLKGKSLNLTGTQRGDTGDSLQKKSPYRKPHCIYFLCFKITHILSVYIDTCVSYCRNNNVL